MRLPGTPVPLDILYVVVTVCVSIHTLQTKYLTALGGTSKLSSHFPLHSTSVLFGFSTSATMQMVDDIQAAVTWSILVQPGLNM